MFLHKITPFRIGNFQFFRFLVQIGPSRYYFQAIFPFLYPDRVFTDLRAVVPLLSYSGTSSSPLSSTYSDFYPFLATPLTQSYDADILIPSVSQLRLLRHFSSSNYNHIPVCFRRQIYPAAHRILTFIPLLLPVMSIQISQR